METSILLVLLTVTCTEVAGKPGQKTCSNLLTNPGGCEEFAQLYKSNHDNSDPCSYDIFKEFIKTEPNVNRAVDLCLKSNGWFRHLCQGFCDTCTDVDAAAKEKN